MSAVGVDTSGRLAFCVKRTLLINVGGSYGSRLCMSMLWCAVSFSALMDGKKFDDLVPFSDRHCIFSPFSELDFWLV